MIPEGFRTDLIGQYLLSGEKFKFWYDDDSKFLKNLFQEDFEFICRVLAATSISSTIQSNVALTLKFLYQHQFGLPLEGYMPNAKMQLEKILKDQPFGSGSPKITAFQNSLLGNKEAVVVDTWIARAFGLEKKKNQVEDGEDYFNVSKAWYNACEIEIRNLASMRKIAPREVVSMLWTGIRISEYGKTPNLKRFDTYKQIFLKKTLPESSVLFVDQHLKEKHYHSSSSTLYVRDGIYRNLHS